MRKGLYLTGYYLPLALAVLLIGGVLAAVFAADSSFEREGLFLALAVGCGSLAAMLAVVSVVVIAMMVYRMWAALPASDRRTTPGQAVGLSFIPFFNFYWIFQVYPGYATDYNAHVAKRDLPLQPLPHGLFVAFCVFALLGLIPYLGFVFLPVSLVLMGIVISRVCDGVNALEAALEETTPLTHPDSTRSLDVGAFVSLPPYRPVPAPAADGGAGIALGVFAILLVLEGLSQRVLTHFSGDWDVTAAYWALALVFGCLPLAMGFFVRSLPLRIVVFALAGIHLFWRAWDLWQYYR